MKHKWLGVLLAGAVLLPTPATAAPTLGDRALQQVSDETGRPLSGLQVQGEGILEGGLQAFKVVDPQAGRSYRVFFKNGTLISEQQYRTALEAAKQAHGKKSKNLVEKLKGTSQAETVQVGVWTADLPSAERAQLEQRLQAKHGANVEELKGEAKYAYRTERVQGYQAAYEKHQERMLDKWSKLGVRIVYRSGISPFVLVEATPDQLAKLEQDPHVTELDWHDDRVRLALATSVPDIRADITRDTYGLKGIETSGNATRVAVCEPADGDGGRGVAFTSMHLAAQKGGVYNPNTSLYSNHATMVAGIIVNSSAAHKGIVPSAKLYDATWNSGVPGDEYKAIEWAVAQGVEVINQSYGGNSNTYDLRARWTDHIAIAHSVHMVAAGGNDGAQTTPSPAVAYNVIGVGAVADEQGDGTNPWNDTWYAAGTWRNIPGGPNKPDVAAPGVNITSTNRDGGFYSGWSGTSFAAPHVTGVVAQLIGADSGLAVRQASMKAVLMAGAYRHASNVGTGFIFNAKAFSDYDGAGVIDALESYLLVKNKQWRTYTTSAFPLTIPFTVSATSQRNRVAVSWLKKNLVVEGASTPTMSTEVPLADLDLYVYDPSGALVGYSTAGPSSVNNNAELVEFLPQVPGTYTLKVVGASGVTSPEYVGVAWW